MKSRWQGYRAFVEVNAIFMDEMLCLRPWCEDCTKRVDVVHRIPAISTKTSTMVVIWHMQVASAHLHDCDFCWTVRWGCCRLDLEVVLSGLALTVVEMRIRKLGTRAAQ